MLSHGVEVDLVKAQLNRNISIFRCHEWALFSDVEIELAKEPSIVRTTPISSKLSAEAGEDGIPRRRLERQRQFHKVFRRLEEDGRWSSVDVIVKVDPDAVFFPSRLLDHLRRIPRVATTAMFFANCGATADGAMVDVQARERPQFMYGPLEIFSRGALEAFFQGGHAQCRVTIDESDEMWEDRYMTLCLEMTGVEFHTDLSLDLLADSHCQPISPYPCLSDSVAFHAFPTVKSYFACHDQADDELAMHWGEDVVRGLVPRDREAWN